MTQRNLTYSVRGIFTHCLRDQQASHYLIAAYQRGYKWDSGPPETVAADAKSLQQKGEGQVDKLLMDLWRAFLTPVHTGGATEYYLQFLTLKPWQSAGGPLVLEVIDGQQRLTTLSLFFAVAAHLLRQSGQDATAFTFVEQVGQYGGKLQYAVRERFLDAFVYQDNVRLLLAADTWEAFLELSRYPANSAAFDCDQQDIYYLYKAARKIQSFLINRLSQLGAFAAYVADCGQLIANVIADDVSSEAVFSDLNSNRIPLTDTELIKGLLLTRASRRAPNDSFQRVQELRAAQGREWDELVRWLHHPSVQTLFGFTPEHGLWQFLHLVARRLAAPLPDVLKLLPENEAVDGLGFPLYEFLDYLLSWRTTGPTAADCFAELQLLVGLLQDWYDDPHIHNMLGVLQVSKHYGKQADLLEKLTAESHLLAGGPHHFLREEISKLSCLKSDLKTLAYDTKATQAFDLLLLLNVFPDLSKEKSAEPQMAYYPFNFARFNSESWSLEHIYPQHPKWEGDIAPSGTEDSLLDLIVQPLPEEITRLLQARQLAPLEAAVLQNYLHADNQFLHSLGNLALLTGGDNSSMSNATFHEKRQRLMRRVRQGSFVPPHTLAVFSKLVLPESSALLRWNKADISLHLDYLTEQRDRLVREFSAAAAVPAS